VVGRGGRKSQEDFRREVGRVTYGMEKLMSRLRSLINHGNRALRGRPASRSPGPRA
jgi:hypothetical protein